MGYASYSGAGLELEHEHHHIGIRNTISSRRVVVTAKIQMIAGMHGASWRTSVITQCVAHELFVIAHVGDCASHCIFF